MMQPGRYLTLVGGKVDMYHGCMRLAVDSQNGGQVEPSKVKPFEAKVLQFAQSDPPDAARQSVFAKGREEDISFAILSCANMTPSVLNG